MTKPIAKPKTVGKDFSVLKPEGPYCSFCAKGAHEVQFIIAGAMVFICDECVFSALDILHEEGIKRDGNKRGWMKVGKQIGDAIRNRRKRT